MLSSPGKERLRSSHCSDAPKCYYALTLAVVPPTAKRLKPRRVELANPSHTLTPGKDSSLIQKNVNDSITRALRLWAVKVTRLLGPFKKKSHFLRRNAPPRKYRLALLSWTSEYSESRCNQKKKTPGKVSQGNAPRTGFQKGLRRERRSALAAARSEGTRTTKLAMAVQGNGVGSGTLRPTNKNKTPLTNIGSWVPSRNTSRPRSFPFATSAASRHVSAHPVTLELMNGVRRNRARSRRFSLRLRLPRPPIAA